MPALVWIHFEALSDIQARCKYCAAVLTVTNGSTKGLWTHVSRKHKQEHLTFNYETKEAVEQIQAIAKEPIVRGIASRQQAVKVESKGKSEEKPPLPPIEITKKAEPKRKRRLKYRENSIGAMLKSVLQSGEPKTIDEKLNETIENVLANGLLKKDDKEQDEEQAKEKLDQRKNAVVEEPLFKFSVKEEMISDSEEPSTSKNSHSDSTISLGSTLSAAFYVEYRKTLKEFGYTLSPEMEQSGGEPVPAFSVSTLIEAFRATVSRDYEKAISLVRNTVKSGHAFTADDLELLDHVFACVLNTSHYDETMIEVCWEWIEAFERPPRTVDARVVAGSTLSIYFAYHTVC
ncbi:unnamed protein product, partial [Mesorhabditis belari]|uniref:BED-type domain-containing protein n=1 Tax=Mesorhabditis belari TaxID=2138241 RepID=A0AAF3J8W5_9BILA